MSEKKTETKQLNIFQRMSAITAELRTVAKNLDVKAGGGSYKAVSERDIIDAVKPLEEKYGIYSYPCDREILESEMLENEKTYNGNTTKTTSFFTRIKTTYMFVNVDNPEERITTITFSEGIDPQDKGSGKAMTYADKYALMKAYKISTGDDPDQAPSEEGRYQKSGTMNNRRQEAGANKPAPIICKSCGKPIPPAITKTGVNMSPAEVANLAINRLGAPYCANCQKTIEVMSKLEKEGTNDSEQQSTPV